MKKLRKFYSSESDTNEEEPPSVRPLEPPFKTEVFHVEQHENAFFVPKAHFSFGGDSHCVLIRFEEGSGRKMKLLIDGEIVFQVNTKSKLEGNADLSIDGMVVDFVWDLNKIPKFSFFTREFSFHKSTAGSSSGSGGDDDGAPDHHVKRWEDHEHVYMMQILGI